MNMHEHRVKAARIIEGLEKLDPAQDAYAVIDGTMVAGYHIGNALLHASEASPADMHWNTPSKLEIGITHLPQDVRSGFDMFAQLEALRQRYVRNADVPDESVAREAMRLLRAMAQALG